MPDRHPQIVFTLSGEVGITPTRLLSSIPERVDVTSGDGSGVVLLAATDTMRYPADAHYTIAINVQDSAGKKSHIDLPSLKLYVPTEGGNLVDLLPRGENPLVFYVSDTQPPFARANMWWLNTSAGGSKLYTTEAI